MKVSKAEKNDGGHRGDVMLPLFDVDFKRAVVGDFGIEMSDDLIGGDFGFTGTG